MQYCLCLQTLSLRAAVAATLDEVVELVTEPSMDELSDVCYGIGRILGSVMGKPYVPVLGDKRHIAKMNDRMHQHGCVRSPRHLVDGICPSAG